MMNREFLKKLESHNEALLRELHARHWEKRRQRNLRYDDAENSDSMSDVKATKCVTKHKFSSGDFNKKKTKKMSEEDGFLNSAKFVEDKVRSNKVKAVITEDKMIELDNFKMFMPNVSNKQQQGAGSYHSKQKSGAATYEQLGALKRARTKEKKVKKSIANSISKKKLEEMAHKEENALSRLSEAIAPIVQKPKPWTQFCRNAQNALTVLNDEVSTALRDSFCSIDDIQMRIRKTMDEIRECDKMYEILRMRQKNSTGSMTLLKKLEEGSGANGDKLFKILGAGPLQTRSENQVRMEMLPIIQESIFETDLDHKDEVELEPESKSPVSPERFNDRLARALHNKFVCPQDYAEIEKKERERTKVKRSKSPPNIQIAAEELYVPEKINKIAATNLNTASSDVSSNRNRKKASQFLYRERIKQPEDIKKPASAKVPMKYADSVLFAKRDKKNPERSYNNLIIKNMSSNESKFKQEYGNLTLQSGSCKAGLDCFDILDEITLNDVKPIDSEYPRRDTLGAAKSESKSQTSYLYKLVNSPMQDEFLKLLRFEEPRLKCSENCCEECPKFEKPKAPEQKKTVSSETISKRNQTTRRRISRKHIKKDNTSDVSIMKPVYAKQKRKKNVQDNIASRLKPYMFDPHIRYPTTITVVPAMITTYTNPNFVKNVTKALAERDQAGDHSRPNNKPTKPLKSFSNIEKRKPITNKPLRPEKTIVQARRLKPVFEQMHGDSWDDYENTTTALKPIVTKSNEIAKFKPKKPDNWETNIQGVIEMVETKIVEILENPESTHLEAFKAVENTILEILNTENCLPAAIEEAPQQVQTEPEKLCPYQNLRSHTTSNIKPCKEKKHSLRSKTQCRLSNITPPTTTRNVLTTPPIPKTFDKHLTVERPPSSEDIFYFLETITNISTEEVDIRFETKKNLFYQRRIKIPTFMRIRLVYYQITRYGTYTKKTIERPKQTHTQTQPKDANLTTTTHTYKISEESRRKPDIRMKRAEGRRPTFGESSKTVVCEELMSDLVVSHNILNYLYASLFAIVFFGLTFNYSCR